MDTESLGKFYQNLPFERRFVPDDQPAAYRERTKINSWGIDERAVLTEAETWLEKTAPGPFFLQFLTSSTHHPYSVPADERGPFPQDDSRINRYKNALHFLDAVLGRLFQTLAERGLRDNTLIFIVGDHGEAFGDLHDTNFTHKNHIYDENIRNFLVMIDPGRSDGPLFDRRIASLGDVAPTILSRAGTETDLFRGESLLAADYREKIVYFHKNAQPEKWGLRDGRWKFIAEKIGGRHPELYDMNADPDEQHSVAATHPDMVKEYGQLCAQWFVDMNDEYTSYLRGFAKAGGVRMSAADLQSYGPKKLVFGSLTPDGKFVELKTINPAEDMQALTFGVPFPDKTAITYEWTSPTSEVRRFNFTYDPDWSKVQVFHAAPGPMVEGRWQLRLLQGERELLRGHFTVDAHAPVLKSRRFR
jgi:hypothetical protein